MAKTASELSREELRSYRPCLSIERHRTDPGVSRRRDDAWKVARLAAEMLKKRFGAIRVVVFGSLAQKTVFTEWSDIDLAVWGIAPEEYYSAAGAAMDMGLEKGIRVDVVDPRDCEPQFLAAIEQEGIGL
jgi:predicted nucleotidyltransferase